MVGMAAWAVRYAAVRHAELPVDYLRSAGTRFLLLLRVRGGVYLRRPKSAAGNRHQAPEPGGFLMWGVGMFVGTQLSGYTAQSLPRRRCTLTAKRTARN